MLLEQAQGIEYWAFHVAGGNDSGVSQNERGYAREFHVIKTGKLISILVLECALRFSVELKGMHRLEG